MYILFFLIAEDPYFLLVDNFHKIYNDALELCVEQNILHVLTSMVYRQKKNPYIIQMARGS